MNTPLSSPREVNRGTSAYSLVLIVLAAALIIYPLARPGIPSTADGPLHLIRGVEFDAVLRSGVLYPRWAPDLAYGYGYPLFNFYSPLFYYLTEIPHLVGASFELALQLVIFACVVLYGLGAYWWTRPFLGEAAATIAGVAYMYVPFRFHEIYTQGDYPQFFAFALAPLALGALYRLLASRQISFWHLLGVTGTLGAILLAHNISTLWLAPTLAGYTVVIAIQATTAVERSARLTMLRNRLAAIAIIGLLSIGLTAFFWLPALAEQNLVQLYRLRTDDFDVRHSFLDLATLLAPPHVFDQTAGNPPPLLHLGWGELILALLSVPLVFAITRRLAGPTASDDRRARKRAIASHLIFGWILLLASAAMTVPISLAVWRRVPLIAYTEYPWRILELSGLATALLAGIAVHLALELLASMKRPRTSPAAIVGVAVLILIVPSLVYLYPHEPFLTYGNLSAPDVTAFERAGGAVGTTSTGEYYPLDVVDRPTAPLPTDISTIGRLDRSRVPTGAQVSFLGSEGYTERYSVTLPRSGSLQFNLIRFDGWQVTVDGHEVESRSTTGDGLLLADVPAGTHLVSINFVDTATRHLGWLIAEVTGAVGVILALARLVWNSRRERKVGLAPRVEVDRIDPKPIDRRGVIALGGGIVGLIALRATSPIPYTALFARKSPLDRIVVTKNPMRIQLDGAVEFLGYDLSAESVEPGGVLTATAYWRALRPLTTNYRALAMLVRLGDAGLLVQNDRPSPGGIPTHTWPTDRYFIDEYKIDIPTSAVPMVYQFQVALYDPKTGVHLQRSDVDGFAGQHISLAQIHVRRSAPVDLSGFKSAGNPTFGGMIQLQGYRVSGDHLKAGQAFQVTFVWRADRAVDRDYTVFTHLVDVNQKQVAGRDSFPLNGQYSTSQWLVGEQVVDTYDITIPPDAPAGPAHLAVGMYDARTMQRLDATAKDWTDQRSQVDLDLPITIIGN